MTIFYACEEENNFLNEEPSSLKQDSFYVKDGILCFNSEDDFLKFREEKSKLTVKEYLEFEKSIGFTSFFSEYDAVTVKLDEAKTEEEFNQVLKDNADIVFVQNNVIEPVIQRENYQNIVNKDGLYMVGNRLYRVNKNELMLFEDVCADSRDEMLKIASHNGNAIQVKTFTEPYILKSTENYCGVWEEATSGATNKRRCYARIYVLSDASSIGDGSEMYNNWYYVECYTRAEKKRWKKWYKYNSTKHYCKNVEIVVEAPTLDCATCSYVMAEQTITLASGATSGECGYKKWIDETIGETIQRNHNDLLPEPVLKRVKGSFWTRGSNPKKANIDCGYAY